MYRVFAAKCAEPQSIIWPGAESFNRKMLAEPIQISIGRWITQSAAHGNHLPFVVKCVRKHVMQHKSWSANSDVSIWKANFCITIKLLIRYL